MNLTRRHLLVPLTVFFASQFACTRQDNEQAKRKLREAGRELKQEARQDSEKAKQEAKKAGEELRRDAHKAKQQLDSH